MRGSYWPMPKSREKSIQQHFDELFAHLGWEECDDRSVEAGCVKIALYCKDGEPTHAARLLSNGFWTSKLGQNVDISHSLEELEGGDYGSVSRIFALKPKPEQQA